MRLLDRYLLRELLVPLALCFGGVLLCFNTFDLANQLPLYQARGLTGADILEYYLCVLPETLPTVLPASLLLALLYALSRHARYNELVAMRAAGVGLWRLAAPYLAVGLLATVILFLGNEWIGPDARTRADRILNRRITNPAEATAIQWRTNVSFRNESDHRSWNLGAFNLLTHEMLRVNIEWEAADGTRRQLFAEKGRRENDAWRFDNAVLFLPDPQNPGLPLRVSTNSVTLAEFTESPGLIVSEIKIGSMDSLHAAKRIRLSLRDIYLYRHLHPRLTGPKAAELATQWHGRLALPWTSLVVVLIALPFGCLPGRRNVAAGVGMAIFICFGYLFLSRFALALGTGGHLPGWVAGWLPNLAFGGLGLGLLRALR